MRLLPTHRRTVPTRRPLRLKYPPTLRTPCHVNFRRRNAKIVRLRIYRDTCHAIHNRSSQHRTQTEILPPLHYPQCSHKPNRPHALRRTPRDHRYPSPHKYLKFQLVLTRIHWLRSTGYLTLTQKPWIAPSTKIADRTPRCRENNRTPTKFR